MTFHETAFAGAIRLLGVSIVSIVIALLGSGCESPDRHLVPQAEEGSMDRAAALQFVDRLIEAVEGQALPPRELTTYLVAKAALHETARATSTVDRAQLYRQARTVLGTLDTDGHTILWSEAQTAAWYGSTKADSAAASDVAKIATADGYPVLVVQPPQTTFRDLEPSGRYTAMPKERTTAIVARDRTCGLVVDLTESKGGNASLALGFVGGTGR